MFTSEFPLHKCSESRVSKLSFHRGSTMNVQSWYFLKNQGGNEDCASEIVEGGGMEVFFYNFKCENMLVKPVQTPTLRA